MWGRFFEFLPQAPRYFRWEVSSRVLGFVFAGIGLLLLLVALLGDLTELGDIRTVPPRSWEAFDASLVHLTRDVDSFLSMARYKATRVELEASDRELMNALYTLATERFAHGAAEHTIFSNWIIWLQGLPRPHPIRLSSPEELLKRGSTAVCGQVSQLLTDMARKAGIEARTIQLQGHVVMEAFFEGEWHMYDADAEVGPMYPGDSVEDLSALIADPKKLEKLYGARNPNIIPIILSTAGNHVADLNPERLEFERIANAAKFVIPLVLLLSGYLLLIAGSGKVRPRNA